MLQPSHVSVCLCVCLTSPVQACAGADVGLVFVGGSMVELSKTPEGAFRPATEGEGLGKGVDRNVKRWVC
jgi:hypothetical protein